MDFPQAAALVIGMDVGTTVKAVIASIGRSTATRRTAYAHVVYNLITACLAFVLLTPYVWLWESLSAGSLQRNAEIALVAFHTGFNIIGLSLMIPLANPFAGMVERLAPEHRLPLLDRLERTLLKDPGSALMTVQRTLRDISLQLFDVVSALMHHHPPDKQRLETLAYELDQIHAYVDEIHLNPREQHNWPMLTAAIHVLDHLQRLHERCEEEPERALTAQESPGLMEMSAEMADVIDRISADVGAGEWGRAERLARHHSERVIAAAESMRENILASVASGKVDVPLGTDRLEAMRWLRRVSYHYWRITLHLREMAQESQGSPKTQAQNN
nr:Na/Pi symporter [Solemya velesiana gill symbiont]